MKKKQMRWNNNGNPLRKFLQIMRLTIFLFFLGFVEVLASNSLAQTTKLSLDVKNSSIESALQDIEKQSDFRFIYNKEKVDVDSHVNVQLRDKSVIEVLDVLFQNKSINYTFFGKNIVLANDGTASAQQQISVSGHVTDSSHSPLPGVSIVIKGTTKGTITNIDGTYSLKNVPANAVLVFSFVGMKTEEMQVEGKSYIDVVMSEDAYGIEEVVAVGYGTQKKVNLTGAVGVASKEIFEDKSVPNAIAAIQGTLPGVRVTKTSGEPGSENYQMQIRGASSINSVGTLVLIDGVAGNLSNINPNDIESISVLKDAAAAAIYGSNAAGGVILVTTKKGKAGKAVVQYNGMYGMTMMGRLPTPSSAYEQMKALSLGFRNAGSPLLEWEDPVRLAWLRGERLDEVDYTGASVQIYPTGRFFVTKSRPNVWQSANSVNLIDEYTRSTNPVQSHNVSVSGGDEKNSFFFSAGYYNRHGILRYGPDSNERYNLRFNSNNELSKNVKLITTAAYTNNNIYQPITGSQAILNYALRYWSSGVTYGPTGEYFASHGLWPSYVQVMKEGGENTTKGYAFRGRSELIIEDLLPGLRFNVVGGVKDEVGKNYKTARTLTYMGPLGTPTLIFNSPNGMSKSSLFSKYSTLQSFATYEFSIKESHNLKLLVGYSYDDYRNESIAAGVSSLVTNDFFSLNWGDPDTKTNSDVVSSWATMAGFGRINYNFMEKYLFEANLRYDGSSRLAPSNRWNAFPSLSAGWNINKEAFFQNVNSIQNLKLRASWGQLGNSNALGLYDYVALLNTSNSLPFNDSPTQYVYQSLLASKSKTWETVETSNIGLDLTAFNRRLTFTADAYIKTNKNMLVNIEVPATLGVGTSSYNYGKLKTKGWEVAIGWKERSRKFKYGITLNLSDNTNKLVKYEGKNIVSPGQVSLIEGLPLNTLWGYKTDGLFQSDQEYQDYGVFINSRTGGGDMKYIDLNDNKKIDIGAGTLEDHGDLVRLGDTNPRYLFGINFESSWKGIDFSCFFQGVGKRQFSLQNGNIWYTMYASFSDAVNLPFKEKLDYWTPENLDAFWPRPYNGGMQSYLPSDYWIQDASYIRLKNVELGYTFPQSIIRKARISKARIFVSGQDLFEFTKTFSWIDPEQPDNSGVIYPFYRSVSLGLNVTF